MLSTTPRRLTSVAAPALTLILAACAGAGAADRHESASGATQTVTISVPSGNTAAPFDTPRKVTIPAGWKMSVWARVDGARLAMLTPDRRLLVSRPGHGDVQVLTPRAGANPAVTTLVSGLRQPHGLAIRGNTLYVAESNQVDTFTYAKGAVSGKRVLIGGLPDAKSPELHGAYAHALKSVTIGRDGTVYVSIGSTGNVSPEDRTASPQRASIMQWSPTTHKLTVYARGVRNGTGLAVAPDGAVWTAVNNRDQIAYPFHHDYDGDGTDDYGKVLQSYVNDHPMEGLARLSANRDLGWPYCHADPDVNLGVQGSALDYTGRHFINDIQTNADGSKLKCSALPWIENGFPAHSAPLGLNFANVPSLNTGALVGTHGSWNRTPPRAPTVTWLPYANGRLGDAQVLVSGFQNADGSRWGRPVSALSGPDGAVYITDDQAGAVYRLARA